MSAATELPNTGNLEAALEYAKMGLRIFPLFYVLSDGTCSCRPRPTHPCKRIGKHPMTKNGVQDATTDEAQIRQWWTEKPFANIGLATGYDGLTVIDEDTGEKLDKNNKPTGVFKKGKESLAALVAANETLPPTRVCKTGSGGYHHYFLSINEISNSQSKIGEDLDVRGVGGYVILPPSNHLSGGKYSWESEGKIADMPEWLEALCGSKIDISQDELEESVKEDARKTKLSTHQLIRLLDFIPPDCDRDTWWKVGAILKHEVGDKKGFDAWDEWSRKAPDKYDPKVMPVQWNSFTDKGLTVGTLYHFAQTLGNFRGFDIEAADAPEFRENWCYVAAIKRFVEFRSFIEWDKEQFDAMTLHRFQRGRPSEHILKNPEFRKIQGATYWPEQPLFVTEYGQEKLNYWRPSGVTPAPGPVEPFLKHICYLYPDPEEAKILLQYLAYQVQHPGEKVHWALLLEGDQGNGKSYFATVMRLVLGQHNVNMVTTKELQEPFTQWQRNTQLVVVEEMMAKGRLELMNNLKPVITEDWCSIREMYRPAYRQPNRFNFLFFSNHRDALILDATDRRYCILKTEVPPHPDKNGYYGPLFDWTRHNGPALAWYLKSQVDLSDFQSKAHAPMSRGKLDMIFQSMLPIDRYIQGQVNAGEYPCRWDVIQPAALIKPLRDVNINASPKDVENAFHRLGFLDIGRKRTGEGDNKVNMWAVRNFDTYRDMNAAQLRQVWMMQVSGNPREVSDNDADAIYKNRPQHPLSDQEGM